MKTDFERGLENFDFLDITWKLTPHILDLSVYCILFTAHNLVSKVWNEIVVRELEMKLPIYFMLFINSKILFLKPWVFELLSPLGCFLI